MRGRHRCGVQTRRLPMVDKREARITKAHHIRKVMKSTSDIKMLSTGLVLALWDQLGFFCTELMPASRAQHRGGVASCEWPGGCGSGLRLWHLAVLTTNDRLMANWCLKSSKRQLNRTRRGSCGALVGGGLVMVILQANCSILKWITPYVPLNFSIQYTAYGYFKSHPY